MTHLVAPRELHRITQPYCDTFGASTSPSKQTGVEDVNLGYEATGVLGAAGQAHSIPLQVPMDDVLAVYVSHGTCNVLGSGVHSKEVAGWL